MRKKRTRLGYGTEFITASVARGMSFSSHELIRSVGKNGVPGAVIAFAVDSFDSIVDYAAVFDAMKGLPQEVIPVLREEAVPMIAKQDQMFMRSFTER